MQNFNFAKNNILAKPKEISTYGDGQFQFEDVGNFIGHHAENLGVGILSGLEGIYDGVVGGVSQMFGQQDYAKALYDDDWSARLGQKVDGRYNPQGFLKKTGAWVRSAGDMLPSIAIGVGLAALTGGSSLVFTSAAQFGNVLGKSTTQAYNQSGELGFKENAYGLTTAAIETAIESALGGVGGLSHGYLDNFAKTLIPNSYLRGMAGEGVEEVVSSLVDPFIQRATIDPNAKAATIQELTQSFIDGAVVSGILQGGQAGVNRVQTQKIGNKILENDKRLKVQSDDSLSIEEQNQTQNNFIGKNSLTTTNSLVEEAKRLKMIGEKSYQRVVNGEKPTAGKLGKLALDVNAKKMDILVNNIAKSQNVDKKQAEKLVNEWLLTDSELALNDYDELVEKHDVESKTAVKQALNNGYYGYEIKQMRDVAKRGGAKNVRFVFDSNAKYDGLTKNSEDVVINLAKGKFDTALHEAVHVLEKTNGYKSIKDSVLELSKTTLKDKAEEIKSKYKADMENSGQDYTQEIEESELVAGLMKDIVKSPRKFIQDINGNKSILKKIKDFLQTTLEKAKVFAPTKDVQQIRKAYNEVVKALQQANSEVKRNYTMTANAKSKLGVQYDLAEEAKKITADTSEEKRYEILKDRTIVVVESKSLLEQIDKEMFNELEKAIKSKAETIIYPMAQKLGIIKSGYKNIDLEFEFGFSKNGGLKESLSKQKDEGGNYADLAKVLYSFDEVVKNAILIEVHKDKYKGTYRENALLENISVLFSVMKDDNGLIPIKLEIKKYKNIENKLYLTVALSKIKEAMVMGKVSRVVNNAAQPVLFTASNNISIRYLFEKINPLDENFLKYIPDKFLDEKQLIGKQQGIAKDIEKINTLRGTTQFSLSNKTNIAEEFQRGYVTPKVYTRKETEQILTTLAQDDLLGAWQVQSGTKTKMIDHLYKVLNNSSNDKARITRIREYVDYLIQNTFVKNTETFELEDEILKTIDLIKTKIMKQVDLSSIKDEIKYKFDKSAGGIMLAWSNKDGKSIDSVVYNNKQDLENIGIDTEKTGADMFFEIYEKYKENKQTLEDLKKRALDSVFEANELTQLRKNYVNEIYQAYIESGHIESSFSIVVKDNLRIKELNSQLKSQLNDKKTALNLSFRIAGLVDTMKNYSKRGVGASHLKNDLFTPIANALSKVVTRGKISNDNIKVAIAGLNTVLGSKEFVDHNGEVNILEPIKGELAALSNLTNKQLTAVEIQSLYSVLRHMAHLYRSLDTTFWKGKRVATEELANKQMNQTLSEKHMNGLIYSGTVKSFCEPRSVFNMITGYTEDSVLMQAFNDISKGETQMNVNAMKLMQPIEKFLKKNKYKKRLKNTIIELKLLNKASGEIEQVEMPLSIAITLFETSKREQAKFGLSKNGFTYKVNKYQTTTSTEEANSKVEANKLTYKANKNQTKTFACDEKLLQTIKESFTQDDLDFMKVIENTLEGARVLKIDTDLILKGVTNVVEGFYFPITRDQMWLAKSFSSEKDLYNASDNAVSNKSFNKNTTPNASQPLFISPVVDVVNNHSRQVAMYNGLAIPIDNFNKIYNKRINAMSVKTVLNERYFEIDDYIRQLFKNLQGIDSKADWFSKIVRRGTKMYATFQLGWNFKTIMSQISSFPMVMRYVKSKYLFKQFDEQITTDVIYKYCPFIEVRNYDAMAVKAALVAETGKLDKADSAINKVGEFSMIGISKMDDFITKQIFKACCRQMADEKGTKLYSDENLKDASVFAEEVIKKTQAMSTQLERTAMQRSGSDIVRSLTIFMSDPVKQFSRLCDAIGEIRFAKQNKDNAKLKKAYSKLILTSTAIISSALMYSVIAILVKKGLGTENEKEQEKSFFNKLVEGVISSIFGLLPIVRDMFNKLAYGYDVKIFATEQLNSILNSINTTKKTIEKMIDGEDLNDEKLKRNLWNTIDSIGKVTGLPTRNVRNQVTGIIDKYIKQKPTEFALDDLNKTRKSIIQKLPKYTQLNN